MPAARHTFAEAHALGEADGQACGLDSVEPRVRLEESGAQCHRQQRPDRRQQRLRRQQQRHARLQRRGRRQHLARQQDRTRQQRRTRQQQLRAQVGGALSRGRASGSIGIGFPLPLHDGLHLRRVCCLRWGECVKGFIGCTAWPIGPLYSPLRGLFTAPWNDP